MNDFLASNPLAIAGAVGGALLASLLFDNGFLILAALVLGAVAGALLDQKKR